MLTGSNPYPTNWLIDASVLQMDNRLYVVGSGTTSSGSPPSLVIAPLSAPYTVSAPSTVISTPTLSWET
ncbi:MAG: hypothetical protein QOF84_2613 [Streptomyces sp.]|nr:hypothetical protein [Streptomyces sp.]